VNGDECTVQAQDGGAERHADSDKMRKFTDASPTQSWGAQVQPQLLG